MEKDEMMRRLEAQERFLRFDTVSLSDLRRIGELVAERIISKGASAYIMIRVNGLEVFALSLEGSSANNRGWALRKANIAELNALSSMHVALDNKGRRTLEDIGLSPLEYTFAGGAFPILLKSGLCIGSIAVSGMPSEEDHQSICSVLSEYLGIEAPSLTE